MSPAQARATTGAAPAPGHVLARLRAGWRRRSELDPIAWDVAITGAELRERVLRGLKVADGLRKRMRTLGLRRDDMDPVAPALMRDLERTRACRNDKGVCQGDLSERPGDGAWQGSCPNAVGLAYFKLAA